MATRHRAATLRRSAEPGTNGFAIASLIFGIIGGALLGFIFGFIALSQTKRTGQGGRGLAIAGLILSAMWTIGLVLADHPGDHDFRHTATPAARSPRAGASRPPQLKVGDCVNDLHTSTDVQSLPGVPCAQSHEGEVFAVFDLPSGVYPGQAAVREQAGTECNDRLAAYSPSALNNPSLGLVTLYPQQQSWEGGDRGVVCIATDKTGPTTGSIQGT